MEWSICTVLYKKETNSGLVRYNRFVANWVLSVCFKLSFLQSRKLPFGKSHILFHLPWYWNFEIIVVDSHSWSWHTELGVYTSGMSLSHFWEYKRQIIAKLNLSCYHSKFNEYLDCLQMSKLFEEDIGKSCTTKQITFSDRLPFACRVLIGFCLCLLNSWQF